MAAIVIAEGPILRTIMQATHKIWSDGLTPAAYERYYAGQLALPWGQEHLRRFALVEGTEVGPGTEVAAGTEVGVLASAKEYAFTATLAGEAIRVLGIGAVFTQPSRRRQGAARELLECLLARAAENGFDLALLFSEIGPDYYARLGFETVPATVLTLRVEESSRRGAPAMMVRFADDRDLPDIVEMGNTRARPFRFHLNRDRDLVHYAIAKKRLQAGLSAAGERSVQCFVAEEGSSAAAYVVISTITAKNEWILEECGDRDPSGARAGAMLQSLIARDPAEVRPSIKARLPGGFRPPQITVTDERPASEIMMVRPLSARARALMPIVKDDVLYWHGDLF